MVLLLAALPACSESEAPDDKISVRKMQEVPEIVSAEEVLKGAYIPTLDPAPMNNAEVRKVVGTGPRCEFRYSQTGKAVLGISSDEGRIDGVVKLNGRLVELSAHDDGAGRQSRQLLQLTADRLRMFVRAEVEELPADRGAVWRRPANMIMEIGEDFRAGYSGYLDCGESPPLVEAAQG